VNITEAKIKLVSDKADKLKAFCSITIDDEFVIRDIKVIEGTNGHFVAMPSRKLMDRCPSCGGKNHLRASYCNECGGSLRQDRVSHDDDGRAKLHADIAHPINSACREKIQRRVVEAYESEISAAGKPGYRSSGDEDHSSEPAPASDDESGVAPQIEPEPEPGPAAMAPPPDQRAASGGSDTFASGIY